MTKYTADDFANAKFAEHERGEFAARICGDDRDTPWASSADEYFTDEEMVLDEWVPVPTKPVLTESEVKKMVGDYAVDDFAAGFAGGFRYAGGEVIPDPEPTNTDKLDADIQAVDKHLTSRQLAEALIELGWKKDN